MGYSAQVNKYSKVESRDYWLIVIDLQTNQSSWFKQDQPVEFADFINDSMVLMILKDCSVCYQALTAENFAQNLVTDEERFNIIDNPARCP